MSRDDVIFLFTTKENLKWLGRAPYVIGDGTFHSASVEFMQLYSLGALVGTSKSCQVYCPLVFALMTRRTADNYFALFNELSRLHDEFF